MAANGYTYEIAVCSMLHLTPTINATANCAANSSACQSKDLGTFTPVSLGVSGIPSFTTNGSLYINYTMV